MDGTRANPLPLPPSSAGVPISRDLAPAVRMRSWPDRYLCSGTLVAAVFGWARTRVLLGSVLLLAAGSKLWQLWDTPVEPWLGAVWPHVGLVQYEVFLAAWLFIGAFPVLLRRVSIVTFLIFAALAALKILRGDPDCGCFGSLRVSPWCMLFLDSCAIALLAAGRPCFQHKSSSRVGLLTPAFICSLLVGVGGAHGAARFESTIDLSTVRAGDTIALRPEDWVGERFPLLDFMPPEVRTQLSSDEWTVVFFYRHCRECRAVVRKHDALASTRRICFIEVPPFDGEALTISPDAAIAHLDPSFRWFVKAPAEAVLSDGRVVSGRSRVSSQQ